MQKKSLLVSKKLFLIIAATFLVSGFFIVPSSVLASRTVTSVTLNSTNMASGNSITVTGGATVSASITVNITNNSHWYSTGWRIAGSSGTYTCVDTSDLNSNGPHTVSFNITAPSGDGTYNLYMKAFSSNGCTGGSTGSFIYNNGIIVSNAPVKTDQIISVTSSGPTFATYKDSFNVSASSNSSLPVAITTDGACTGSGTGTAAITMTSGSGNCNVHYNQAGNSTYNPALEIVQTTAAQPINLTVDGLVANSKVYDGGTYTTFDISSNVLNGKLPGDDVYLSNASGDFDDKNVGTAKNVIASTLVLAGADAGNYTVTLPVGFTADITPLTITVTAGPDTKTYDGTTSSAGIPVISPALVGGDTSGFTQTFDTKDAGDSKVLTVSGVVNDGNGGGNYNVITETALGQINRMLITLTVDHLSKTYGDSDPVLTYSSNVPGFPLAGDTDGNLHRDPGENIGDYNVVQGTLTISYDYDVTFNNGIFTINPAILTITADDKSITYGDSDPTFTFAYSGFKNGDGETAVWALPTCSVSVPHSNVSTYPIDCSGASAFNYNLNYVQGTLTVTPFTLTVTGITALDKIYDGNTDAIINTSSANLIGVLGTDVVVLDTSSATGAFSDKNAGTGKIVTMSNYWLNGAQAGNYVIASPITTTANINKEDLTVTAVTDSKEYDGIVTSVGVPTLTSGTIMPGDSATWYQVFGDKNVGTGKAIVPKGNINDGNGGLNYSINPVNDYTGVITPLSITVTAVADSKVYDGTINSTAKPTVAPALAAGDDDSTLLQTFDTKDVGTNKTLTPSGIVNDGNGGGDYAVTFVSGNVGEITKRDLTIKADPESKFYGDSDPFLEYTVSGEQGADAFAADLTRQSGEGIGSYNIDTYSLTPAADNYNVSFIPGILTITERPITVTADNKIKTEGDTDPSLTYQITNGSLLSGDSFTGDIARDIGEIPGTYNITQGSLALNSNYVLTFVPAILTINAKTPINTSGGGGGGSLLMNLNTLNGDINHDGKVDILDFSILLSEWGQNGSNLSADLNKDGVVDELDIAIIMANWNE